MIDIDRVDRRQRFTPDPIVLVRRDQIFQIIFGLPDNVESRRTLLFEIRDLCFGGDNIDRCKLSFFYKALVMFKLSFGIANAVALHLQVRKAYARSQ